MRWYGGQWEMQNTNILSILSLLGDLLKFKGPNEHFGIFSAKQTKS